MNVRMKKGIAMIALIAVVLDGTQYQAYAKESVAAVAQTTNVVGS